MSTIWSQLQPHELELVINSYDYRSMMMTLKSNPQHESLYHDWEKAAKERYEKFLLDNHITSSIFSSLNDAPSFNIMTLLSILGVTSLSVLSLGILTAVFAGALVISGIIYFIAAYRERVDTNRRNFKAFMYLEGVVRATEERNLRLGKEPAQESTASATRFSCDDFTYKETDMLGKIQTAVGGGLLAASMLFGTYYLCIAAVVAAIGMTATATALLGPIGLGIAVAATFILGGIYAYTVYKTAQNEDMVRKLNKHLVRQHFVHHASYITMLHKEPSNQAHIYRTLNTTPSVSSPSGTVTALNQRARIMKKHLGGGASNFTKATNDAGNPNSGIRSRL